MQVPLESDGRGLQIINYTRNADSFDGFLVENYIFSHVIIVSKKMQIYFAVKSSRLIIYYL